MPETLPKPVYRRLNANRLKTSLVLAAFPLALLPVVSAGTVLLMSATAASLTVSLAASTLAVVLASALLVARCGSRILLFLAEARPLGPGEEEDLVRTVENLCIGTGLPVPSLHVIESTAANAFATGGSPDRAALVVTRGLLRLLDRRELEGVIAHELSHIGNCDIRLTTTLAALVGIATLPIRMGATAVRLLYESVREYGEFVAFILSYLVPVTTIFWLIWVSFEGLHWLLFNSSWNLPLSVSHFVLGLSVTGAAFHMLFVSPLLALLIRRVVSRDRELLADADAVRLTLDPQGLALALIKTSADATALDVGEGCAHLFLVDPLARGTSPLHEIFPSHPTVGERIDLLARMGNGIAPSAFEAAWTAGYAAGQTPLDPVTPDPADPEAVASEAVALDVRGLASEEDPPPADPRFFDSSTALYERPDGWSRVLARLPEQAAVTVVGTEGLFTRVVTKDNLSGYVSSTARLVGLANEQPV